MGGACRAPAELWCRGALNERRALFALVIVHCLPLFGFVFNLPPPSKAFKRKDFRSGNRRAKELTLFRFVPSDHDSAVAHLIILIPFYNPAAPVTIQPR